MAQAISNADVDAYIIEALGPYAPERILVFGSRAWADATPNSDVDVLVIKDDPRRPVERIRAVQALLYARNRERTWLRLPPFDTLVFTAEEVKERLELGDSFITTVMRTARTIYEADTRAEG